MYKKQCFKNPCFNPGYCFNPCQKPCHNPCHKPCHNPCHKPCHKPHKCGCSYHKQYEQCHKGCQTSEYMRCKPQYHQPKQRCVDKYYYHEVPHYCPVNTRYNNHHVYKHKYYPVYTCDKKDYYYDCNKGSCCNF